MKADEVLKVLRITRSTLSHYVRDGKLEVTRLHNGRYDYDEASVYRLLNKDVARRTYLYARVSTERQKDDLSGQIGILKQFCLNKGYPVAGVFSDVASGIGPRTQEDLLRMLDDIAGGKVERVVVLDGAGDPGTDRLEAPEDAAALLRCYGAGRYSTRQVHAVRKALADAGQ